MTDGTDGRYSRAFGLSFALTSLLSALLVVVKETNKDTVFAWMAAATGHHWVTHGVLVVALFVVLGLALASARGGAGPRLGEGGMIGAVVGSTVASGLIVAGFFLFAG